MTSDEERLNSNKTVGIQLPALSKGTKISVWPVGFTSVFQINPRNGEYVPGDQGLSVIEGGLLVLHAPDIKSGGILIVQLMEAVIKSDSIMATTIENTSTYAFRFEQGVWQPMTIGIAHTIGPALNVVLDNPVLTGS